MTTKMHYDVQKNGTTMVTFTADLEALTLSMSSLVGQQDFWPASDIDDLKHLTFLKLAKFQAWDGIEIVSRPETDEMETQP